MGLIPPGLDPDKTAFIIFHAGVGRDIELTGTTLDITPQDIPSISLSRNSLSQLLDQQNFQGFSINGGNFRILNSLILPQTLSRRGEDIAGNELVLQLSLNGLLTASVGSYLGIPDLFNTETGASGIGRFGLMDGESIFSYRGLFPPEPSAWEKQFLGWQTPFNIATDNSQISLPAASLHQAGSIGRHSISGKEYFLVENRHRDPQQNDLTITIQKNDGTTVQQTFTNQDQVFNNQEDGFEELLEAGVLIDVDNFDWSLPGGLDVGTDGQAGTTDDRILNGGMLIWHIDEAVIENQINSGTVNANPNRRGVDLEEADGAQDIGTPANQNFSTQARGTAFDFWWSGNNARVITLEGDTLQFYENRFGNTTTPNNKSNSGALSFFEFYDFSDNLPTSTFRARKTTANNITSITLQQDSIPNAITAIPPGTDHQNFYPKALSVFTTQADSFLIVPGSNSVYSLQLTNSTTPLFDFQQPDSQHPFLGEGVILAENPSQSQTIDLSQWLWNGTSWVQDWQTTAPANKGFLSSKTGDTLFVDFTNSRILTDNGNTVASLANAQQQSSIVQGKQSILMQGNVTITGTNNTVNIDTNLPRVYTGAFQSGPSDPTFYVFTDNSFSLIDEQSGTLFPLADNAEMDWPAIVDLNDDGNNDIIYVDQEKNQLNAKNKRGATLNYFPIQPPADSKFMGTPLVSDIEDDGIQDIFVLVQDSLSININAYNDQGQLKEGFPLFVGSVVSSDHHPIEPVISNKTIYAVSHIGELKAWIFPDMNNVTWPSKYGDDSFNKVSGQLSGGGSNQPATSILVEKETYNWPNPASEQTNIRYQLQGPGTVEIKIIKPGGRVVYEQKFDTAGGLPEEQTINTSNWGSGIYLAMVTAKVNNQQARKIIKIAVVH
ncbi:MAG: T9SS type A sorting domain-containing protein [Balneolaceae bacterium]|nr:T9SS type A sorting domain-containing protein [Balneolaceae bacterium]